MKQKPLSLFGRLLLGGALFAMIGCTDYANDIREVNDRLDAVISGQIEPLKADLEKAVTDLKAAQDKMEKDILAKHKEDIDALKGVDAGLRTDIDKANASIVNLQNALDAQKTELQKAISDLEKKHDGDIKALQDKIAELKADYDKKIDALRADMNEKVAKLEASIAAANAEIEKLKTKDEQLQAQLNLAFSQIRELAEKVDNNYRELKAEMGALQAQVDRNAEAIAANAGNIDVLNAAVAEIKASLQAVSDRIGAVETDLFNHINTFNEFREAINTKVAALEVLVRNLESAIAELENIIPAMQEQIEANKELSQSTAADLAKHQALFEMYKQSVANTFDLLQKADQALQTALDNLSNDLAGLEAKVAENYLEFVNYKATIRTELDEHFAALEAYKQEVNSQLSTLTALSRDNALQIEILVAQNNAKTQIINQLSEQLRKLAEDSAEADNFLNAALQAQIEKHEADVLMLQESISTLQAEVDKLHDEIIRFKANIQHALSVAVNSILSQLDGLDVRVSDIEFDLYDEAGLVKTAIADLEAAYKAADKALEDAYKAADKALQDQIDILKKRVQSLVYVPDYSDGKATVNALKINGTADAHAFIEGRSTLTYKVNPAELAPILAKGEDIFAFDVIGVKTRAADEPQMNIISATANAEKGTITFVVEARNFATEFYEGPATGAQSYSAALVLDNEEGYNDVSSEYTNLIPGIQETTMKIVDAEGTDITGASISLDFPYNSRIAQTMRDGHKVIFIIDGKEIEYSKMAEEGYNVTLQKDIRAITNIGRVNNFVKEKLESSTDYYDYYSAKLKDDTDATAIGNSMKYMYRYTYNGIGVNTSVLCNVTKEKALISLKVADTLNWNYAVDAKTDSIRMVDPSIKYARIDGNVIKVSKDRFDFENVPADAVLSDIINADATPVITSTLEDLVFVADFKNAEAESGNISVTVPGFEWGKTYTVKAVYSTATIDIELSYNLTTIDRNREPLTIAIDSTTVTYAKNFELKKGEKKYSIAPVFEALTAGKNLGVSEIKAPEYFEDILSAEHYDAKKNINIVDATTDAPYESVDANWTVLGFDINTDDAEAPYCITPGFTYRTFPNKTIKPEVLYTKTFTTWYGQEITITHTLKFEYPIYNFQHSVVTVAKDDAGAYFTQVLPLYTPDASSNEVSGFKMDNVTMSKEFNIVDGDLKILDDAAVEAAGLVAEYELLGNPGTGIVMKDKNILSYNDKDATVKVRGNLYIESDGGARMQLPTSFDEGQIYATYYVKKYDPIGEVTVSLNDDVNGNIAITNAIDYQFNILDYITLQDNRPFGNTSYDLITKSTEGTADAHWTVGDGENGFAIDAEVTDIYGLKIAYAMDVNSIPVEYRKYIKFDKSTGVLEFLASGMSRLQTVLPVNISFNVEYTWGTREVVIPFRFYSPEL